MGSFGAMTVNERLCEAGLMGAYEAAKRSGDLRKINDVLLKVDLCQDKSGMNWPVKRVDQ